MLPEDTTANNVICSVIDEQNSNLTDAQRELLAWHFRWGHISMVTIQRIIRPKTHLLRSEEDQQEHLRNPIIVRSNFAAHNCPQPMCAACNLSKATKTKISTKSMSNSTNGANIVSMDHYQVAYLGRTLRSRKRTTVGGTIFVDHGSGRMLVHNQASLDAQSTLVGKQKLDREAQELGFKIKSFVSDNGVFRADEFLLNLNSHQQSIHFSGTGAKHQNGVAENAVRTVSTLAQTMPIHASLRWPAAHDLALWPFYFKHAAYIYNRIPGHDGLSPNEKWFKVVDTHDHLKQLHPWGCPGYVLEARLQDGHKIPKFAPRSRQGVFVGYSDQHVSSVALMLNRSTGHISPQFHVAFDDFFTTVRGVDMDSYPDLQAVDWDRFIQLNGTELYVDEDELIEEERLDDNWNRMARPHPTRHFQQSPHLQRESVSQDSLTGESFDDVLDAGPAGPTSMRDEDIPHHNTELEVPSPQGESTAQEGDVQGDPEEENAYESALFQLKWKHSGHSHDQTYLQSLDWGDSFADLAQLAQTSYAQQLFRQVADTVDPDLNIPADVNPLIFSASASNQDNPKWHQAVNGIHSEGFWAAMKLEINTLTKLGAWDLTPLTKDMKVLPSTWAFKIKRFPSGLVKKLKARICVMGNKQVDIDPFECYAPVVSWSTVRLMLILSIILGWKSIQVDYTSAFCQAKINKDVYVSQPRGWQHLNRMGLNVPFKEGHVMKLRRCLYGLRQSPKNWFLHLKERLESVGFKQSACDPCLFYQGGIICLCYVDDCVFFSKDNEMLEKVVQDIKDAELDLNVEDDVAGFLGVLLTKNDDGTISLTQTCLIQRILDALGLKECNSTKTPAQKAALPLDKD